MEDTFSFIFNNSRNKKEKEREDWPHVEFYKLVRISGTKEYVRISFIRASNSPSFIKLEGVHPHFLTVERAP